MKTVGLSHVGNVRTTNEDTLMIKCEKKPQYMLIADGMGGHAAGEIASNIAAESVQQYIDGLKKEVLTQSAILGAIQYANKQILQKVKKDKELEGMGTTLTFAHVDHSNLLVAHVGDSSAYLFDGTTIGKLTKDHTYVQYLIDSGVIRTDSKEDYPFKNIITRALGIKKLEVDFYNAKWKQGDFLLLCSDGLSSYVGEDLLKETLAGDVSLEDKAQHLLDLALEAGGKDNISIIIAENTPGEDCGI